MHVQYGDTQRSLSDAHFKNNLVSGLSKNTLHPEKTVVHEFAAFYTKRADRIEIFL